MTYKGGPKVLDYIDQNGHQVSSSGELLYDEECAICEPLVDHKTPEKSHSPAVTNESPSN